MPTRKERREKQRLAGPRQESKHETLGVWGLVAAGFASAEKIDGSADELRALKIEQTKLQNAKLARETASSKIPEHRKVETWTACFAAIAALGTLWLGWRTTDVTTREHKVESMQAKLDLSVLNEKRAKVISESAAAEQKMTQANAATNKAEEKLGALNSQLAAKQEDLSLAVKTLEKLTIKGDAVPDGGKITVEGVVVSEYDRILSNIVVTASRDGSTIAVALTDNIGRFKMQIPSGSGFELHSMQNPSRRAITFPSKHVNYEQTEKTITDGKHSLVVRLVMSEVPYPQAAWEVMPSPVTK